MSSRLPTLYSLFLNLEALAYHFCCRMDFHWATNLVEFTEPRPSDCSGFLFTRIWIVFFFFFSLSLSLSKESVALSYLYYNGCNLNGWGLLQEIFWSLVHFSCSVVFNYLHPHGLQHTRPPCPSPTPRAYSNSSSLSRCCHPTI